LILEQTVVAILVTKVPKSF